MKILNQIIPKSQDKSGTKEPSRRTTINQGSGSKTYTINSSADKIFVNGVLVSSNQLTVELAAGETKYVQIITQDGSGAAYINVVKFVA